MSQLPIETVLDDLFQGITKRDRLIVKAPPGAGKSTRLPLALLERDLVAGKILMLEPRRLAARNIANYLASQRGESLGETVGLRVRGESRTSKQTRLEVVTEGVLTRMVQDDPELDGVSLIIFDEFHERSIQADVSLALVLDVQQGLRDDLKVMLMSATLDDDALLSLLPDAAVITSEGRCHPVTYDYMPVSRQRGIGSPSYESLVAAEVSKLMLAQSGSALVFLPGVAEIKRTADELKTRVSEDVLICPLYGQLSPKEQQQAIAPCESGKRKIVLATNIAETSLTIEGIRLVVDSGLERVARFNRKTGITRLETVQIARSSAIQRAGRAGRIEAGHCLRLYGEDNFQRMRAVPEPEIVTSDLTSTVLELAQWGATPDELLWLDSPPELHWTQASALLVQLGLLQENQTLTAMGRAAHAFGTEPRLAAMLAFAKKCDDKAAQSTACWLAAWSEEPLRGFREPDLAKHLVAVSRQKGNQARRARYFAEKLGCSLSSDMAFYWLPVLASVAWPDRVAKARGNDGRYQLSNGHGAELEPDHPMTGADYLVVADLMTVKQGNSKIFVAAELDISELENERSELFTDFEWVDWDDNKGRIIAERQRRLGRLVVDKTAIASPDQSRITDALLSAVRRKGLSSLSWNTKSESLLTRARCAMNWCIGPDLPDISDDGLLAQLETWLAPFMVSVTRWSQMNKIDLNAALEAYIGWEAAKDIDRLLPETYKVPTGSGYRIRYQVGQKPVLAVRMQEVFGEATSPTIADGKVTLVLELLSPAQRPLQITQDLAGFWQGAYREVQKEMKGRYPKHVWPDDPANHVATNKTKRHFKQ
ncbi:ATP-dependent helicase HrpB [Veronia nyctiphanis]|uniref:ATP-dependent helicase HrpB n=1 Tax=Veronia nyctiphanis TaxID=1278244 RepID=A0A4Q0YPJ5_9GAMM|nr:ATP-dependent helicase HrpB [Veronia nyctiphanis]RXJ72445.1 ATP-dependent helicase HrpB [Veronia nyctiphanis]